MTWSNQFHNIRIKFVLVSNLKFSGWVVQLKNKRKMGRLFDTTPVSDEVVRKIVKENWPALELGKILKESQNVTYEATIDGKKVCVRATATPGCQQRVYDEVTFLRYVKSNGVSACGPIEPGVIFLEGTIVTVTEWAEGAPVAGHEFKWCTEEAQVKAQGRWFRKLHDVSRQFQKDQPEVANRI